MLIKVADDFSEIPGPRFPRQGDHSGQEFYVDILYPRYKLAVELGERLSIDLNDVEGYATGFLDESFGHLARVFGTADLDKTLQLIVDDRTVKDDVQEYIDAGDSHRIDDDFEDLKSEIDSFRRKRTLPS
jgi:hypothetical protein